MPLAAPRVTQGRGARPPCGVPHLLQTEDRLLCDAAPAAGAHLEAELPGVGRPLSVSVRVSVRVSGWASPVAGAPFCGGHARWRCGWTPLPGTAPFSFPPRPLLLNRAHPQVCGRNTPRGSGFSGLT